MEDRTEYLQQISEIKSMMEKSSRFLSLSGVSCILAGVFATVGAIAIFFLQTKVDFVLDYSPNKLKYFILIAFLVLFSSVCVGFLLSAKKAKKSNEKLLSEKSKLFLFHLAVPVLCGGVLTLLLFYQRQLLLISPITLIFYGLGLVSASKYSFQKLALLGIVFILLGLLNVYFVGYGLYLWTAGFGLAHIIYGSYMHFKWKQ